MESKRKIHGKHVSGTEPRTPSRKKNKATRKSIKRKMQRESC